MAALELRLGARRLAFAYCEQPTGRELLCGRPTGRASKWACRLFGFSQSERSGAKWNETEWNELQVKLANFVSRFSVSRVCCLQSLSYWRHFVATMCFAHVAFDGFDEVERLRDWSSSSSSSMSLMKRSLLTVAWEVKFSQKLLISGWPIWTGRGCSSGGCWLSWRKTSGNLDAHCRLSSSMFVLPSTGYWTFADRSEVSV